MHLKRGFKTGTEITLLSKACCPFQAWPNDSGEVGQVFVLFLPPPSSPGNAEKHEEGVQLQAIQSVHDVLLAIPPLSSPVPSY